MSWNDIAKATVLTSSLLEQLTMKTAGGGGGLGGSGRGWGSLGDLTFDVMGGPTEFTDKQEANFAEHQIIGSKARLQHMGSKLEEISLRIVLHPLLQRDPEADFILLKTAMDQGDPLDLVVGQGNSGLYAGKFVILSMESDRQEQGRDGKIRRSELTVKLKEWVKAPKLGTSARKNPAGLKKTGKAAPPSAQTQIERKTVAGYEQPTGLVVVPK